MPERTAITIAFVLAVIGVGLMIPFDTVWTLVVGTLCLAGFVVFGAIGLLRPSRLGDEPPA